jgi:hypothetical protein
LTFIFNDVYPEAALRRSNLLRVVPEVAAARHRSRREGIPVAFYGALGESASLYMDDQGVHKFAKDDRDLLLTFAQEHPIILLLANSSNAGMVERNLPPGYQMQRHPGSHFLFELTDRRSPAERSLARLRDDEMR